MHVLQDFPQYTTKVNETAERNIHSIVEMERFVFKGAGVVKNWCAKAIIAASYIKYRCVSSSKSTPNELWLGNQGWCVSIGVLHLCMCRKKIENLWMILLKNASQLYTNLEILTAPARKQESLSLQEISSSHEPSLVLRNVKNKDEPLYIFDDDQEKKESEAPTEDVKYWEQTSTQENTRLAICGKNISLVTSKERNNPKETTQFSLTSQNISILNLLESLERSLKKFWAFSQDSSQNYLDPRRILLSLPQVWLTRRWSMESVMRPNLSHFRMLF